ncbi:MAG: hypothetical protein JNL14_16030 [Devosia sp.]|uniref:hypothetical protein n=1 Tax=Devosia sp. TaxID=1871048 RepID=UPI001A620867|nr:hypothetical protein [Devosia sp.]MBL8599242.1 hypothetical protein [Devosia sp.]
MDQWLSDALTKAFSGLWQGVLGGVLEFFFTNPIGIWTLALGGGLLLGWAWKTFGWQGLLSAAVAVLTLGAYGKGWKDRASLDKGDVNAPPPTPRPPTKKPTQPIAPDLDDLLKDIFDRNRKH